MTGNKSSNEIIQGALVEDIGTGDITTAATIRRDAEGVGRIVSKQSGIVAGVGVAEYVFTAVDNGLTIKVDYVDGSAVREQETVMLIEGHIASIVQGERVALNFLARLSGIATLTAEYVRQIAHTRARIVDTRKTTPMLRAMEKAAVVAGGGYNHRMGLYDMVLIKENHVAAAGGILKAVKQTRKYLSEMEITAKIEVEARNMEEVHEALTCDIERIMLDNMTIEEMREAVKLINHQVEVEASGGVNLANVRQIAETGVDYISVGALTHSAPAFDFSLLLDK